MASLGFMQQRSRQSIHSIRIRLQSFWQVNGRLLAISVGATLLALSLNGSGMLQSLEWKIWDAFVQSRPLEAVDPRFLVVTISDADISALGTWPVPDQVLAQILSDIREHHPRAIGIDLYRDLPVGPGHSALVEIFQTTPYLFGIQKRFGSSQVPPSPALAQQGQVAFADLIEDADGTVRRGLLTARDETGQMHVSLGTAVALQYLQSQGITAEPVPGAEERVRFGQIVFQPLMPNDGGYINTDASGYQLLINFRGPADRFETVSLSEVMSGRLTRDLVQERVVLIGSIAESTNDFFSTPYSHYQNRSKSNGNMPGVFIHANVSSQIISAVLDHRPLFRFFPDVLEYLWCGAWTGAGALLSWRVVLRRKQMGGMTYIWVGLGLAGGGGVAIGSSYLMFLTGWWMPIVPSIVGISVAALTSLIGHSQQLQQLAYRDGLTQIANRHYFDQYLIQEVQQRGNLSLILCDVDYFKLYNDTYGHQQGDYCLQQVAMALRRSVGRTDLVARYGGEEFVVVLPRTSLSQAIIIAERMLQQVRSLRLAHERSRVSDWVTISCGLISVGSNSQVLPSDIIKAADDALYVAKQAGRDRFVVAGQSSSFHYQQEEDHIL
jgi:diguanylate cyclase (GGDEF)-like protein